MGDHKNNPEKQNELVPNEENSAPDEQDFQAIIRRRKMFIATAIAGISLSQCDSRANPFAPCLEVSIPVSSGAGTSSISEPTGSAPSSSGEALPAASAVAPVTSASASGSAVSSASASASSTPKPPQKPTAAPTPLRPCLSRPRPCLSPPKPCLSEF